MDSAPAAARRGTQRIFANRSYVSQTRIDKGVNTLKVKHVFTQTYNPSF